MLPWLHDTTTGDEWWSAPTNSRRRPFYGCLPGSAWRATGHQAGAPGAGSVRGRGGGVCSHVRAKRDEDELAARAVGSVTDLLERKADRGERVEHLCPATEAQRGV